MIQMVGPADNDYIYIDFKDFKYDQKWEFPRENLELGTQPLHAKTVPCRNAVQVHWKV